MSELALFSSLCVICIGLSMWICCEEAYKQLIGLACLLLALSVFTFIISRVLEQIGL